MGDRFTAMVIRESDGGTTAGLEQIGMSELPDYPVLVKVEFSTLNYKDGLAISGKGRIARRLPMVAGADLSGTVVESGSPDWKPGDKVIVNGWGMTETEWGGYSQFQRLKPEWLTRLPAAFTTEQAMAIGTAGYTAALCVDALERYGALDRSEDRPVIVTGAAGGVGSVAVALLSALGYPVAASTGRATLHDYLRGLGATSFVDRTELQEKGRPLQKEMWQAGVDTVGSTTLANVLAQTRYGSAVAACGLAGGGDLPGTVMPHILRGVALLGVDSVMAPHAMRDRAWTLLANHLDKGVLASMTQVRNMSDLPALADDIIAGRIAGRVVIRVA